VIGPTELPIAICSLLLRHIGESHPPRRCEASENQANEYETPTGYFKIESLGHAAINAAVYAAMLGQQSKAEEYRKAGLRLSGHDPQARLRSAQVLAQFHRDRLALAELDLALKAGLSPTEITNNPAWQRFAAYPEYAAMMAKAQKKK
jgi:hypothetical protein